MFDLKVLPYSHPHLNKKVPKLDLDPMAITDLLESVTELLYGLGVWGIAAPEVGLNARFFVMDLSENRESPQCFINPEIIEKKGTVESEEDSLSLPGIGITVSRAKEVTISYQDETGQAQTLKADGIAAICVQQKIDQLNGITLLDSLSSLKKERLLKKIKKNGLPQTCGHGCGHEHH